MQINNICQLHRCKEVKANMFFAVQPPSTQFTFLELAKYPVHSRYSIYNCLINYQLEL